MISLGELSLHSFDALLKQQAVAEMRHDDVARGFARSGRLADQLSREDLPLAGREIEALRYRDEGRLRSGLLKPRQGAVDPFRVMSRPCGPVRCELRLRLPRLGPLGERQLSGAIELLQHPPDRLRRLGSVLAPVDPPNKLEGLDERSDRHGFHLGLAPAFQ